MLVLSGERVRAEVVRFSPDGRALVVPTYKGLQVWRGLPHPGPRELLADHRFARTLAFTPDGSKLFLDGGGFSVRNLSTGESRPVVLWGEKETHFGLSPDGRLLVVGQNHLGQPNAHLACRPVADLSPAAARWTLTLSRPVYSRPVFLRGGDEFLVTEFRDDPRGGYSFPLVVRDTLTGAVVREVPKPEDYAIEASPDGRLLAARRTVWVHVLDAADPAREVARLRNDSRKEFTGAAFHPSGKYLATASNDAAVKFWDTATWAVARTFTWDAGKMRSVAFSPDGALAAAGTDKGQVVVWDLDV